VTLTQIGSTLTPPGSQNRRQVSLKSLWGAVEGVIDQSDSFGQAWSDSGSGSCGIAKIVESWVAVAAVTLAI